MKLFLITFIFLAFGEFTKSSAQNTGSPYPSDTPYPSYRPDTYYNQSVAEYMVHYQNPSGSMPPINTWYTPHMINPGSQGVYIPSTPIPINPNGVPTPAAGAVSPGGYVYPHTTMGGRLGDDGTWYRQSATFNGGIGNSQYQAGQIPWVMRDWSNHGRRDHGNVHDHRFQYCNGGWSKLTGHRDVQPNSPAPQSPWHRYAPTGPLNPGMVLTGGTGVFMGAPIVYGGFQIAPYSPIIGSGYAGVGTLVTGAGGSLTLTGFGLMGAGYAVGTVAMPASVAVGGAAMIYGGIHTAPHNPVLGGGYVATGTGAATWGAGATLSGLGYTGAGAAVATVALPLAAAAGSVTVAGGGIYQVVKQSPSNGYIPSRGSWSTNYFDSFYDLYIDPFYR